MPYREQPPSDPKQEQQARARAELKAVVSMEVAEREARGTREERLSLIDSYRRISDLFLAVLLTPLPLGLFPFHNLLGKEVIKAGLLGVFVLPLLGILFAVFGMPRIRLRRERRWLQSLPFQLEGYLGVLRRRPERSTQVARLTVGLAPGAASLEDALVRGLFSRLDPDAEVSVQRSEARVDIFVESSPIKCPDRNHQKRTYSNQTLRRWLQRALREALLPLHKAYPIARVEVGRRS
jgi:hypothetical protein